MFHPIGSQPPSVYWRRRLALLISFVALIALIAVTAHVLFSKDSGTSSAAGAGAASTSPRGSSTAPSTRPAPSSTTPSRTTQQTSKAGSSGATSPAPSTSTKTSAAPPKACVVKSLGLAAASDHATYAVGAQPNLSILVTNKSATPCVQDLADPQIVLRVYNGEARVWGSHDCKIVPGTSDQTLMGHATVRVTVAWSGLSSEKNCKGTRQRVGAGTYTLYASLAGREGTAAQFAIT